MKSFRADYVFPVCADPIKNGIVTVDDKGHIMSITDDLSEGTKFLPVEQLSGIICPGFVNTHCHLELSHLKGKIPAHSGLVEFIKNILHLRGSPDKEITEAAEKADTEMY